MINNSISYLLNDKEYLMNRGKIITFLTHLDEPLSNNLYSFKMQKAGISNKGTT
jgi:hypothetical protein